MYSCIKVTVREKQENENQKRTWSGIADGDYGLVIGEKPGHRRQRLTEGLTNEPAKTQETETPMACRSLHAGGGKRTQNFRGTWLVGGTTSSLRSGATIGYGPAKC